VTVFDNSCRFPSHRRWWGAVAAAARRPQAQDVTGRETARHLVGQPLGRVLVTTGHEPVLPRRTRPAAVETPRRAGTAFGDERQRDVLEHLEVALDAVAAPPAAGATTARPQP